MKPIVTFVLLGALIVSAIARGEFSAVEMPVSYDDVLALESPEPARIIPYGGSPLQTLSYYPAPNEAVADIVLIHGGCWSADYDRDHARPLAGALQDAGFDVWLPEYRRVGDTGGGWPGSWQDVVAALKKVVAARDADRPMIAVGHSAGGHLALLAATRKDLPLAHVVGLAPITDLVAYGQGDNSCQTMTSRFMGGGPDAVDYRAASPSAQALHIPTSIIQGAADPIVPPAQARAVSGAAVVEVPSAGHFDLIHPGTAALPVLLRVLGEVAR